MSDFFDAGLAKIDPDLFAVMQDEFARQQNQIELIASENITSQAVREAQGSVLTNKYAEGYPGKRYYAGCEVVDRAENLAIERACALYQCAYANVQPHSGSQANQAVYLALLKPHDTILGMDLAAGGHLTHGAKPNQSGKWFSAVHYGVDPTTHLIDFDQVRDLAKTHSPKMIIAGASAYPRAIDFKTFREIADEVGAYLLADMAHYSGLIASGLYPSPLPHAHVVTTTTHKTLRGPRGGMILSNDVELGKKFNSGIFPGLQGGPLMHVIAAKAVAFGEALRPDYKQYCQQVIDNARALAGRLVEHGFAIVSGGTDCHMCLVDLRPRGLKGNEADEALERAGMTCNKNAVPQDPEKPMVTSGIRLGTPAGTTRGFGVDEFVKVADWINVVLTGLAEHGADGNQDIEQRVKQEIKEFCLQFPIYKS